MPSAYSSIGTGNWSADSTWASVWAASTSQSLGSWRRPSVSNNYIYECTTAGTTGSSEPTWPTTVGNTVADGTATWTCRAQYPNAAGDTTTIGAGHTITYDLSSTTQLGAITINGLFSFATNMSTKLTLGHVDITINNGGEFRIGTLASPLPKQYTADVVFATTADNAKGFYLNAGGKTLCYGDPTYYGTNGYKAALAADFTTDGTGPNTQHFDVTGDFSGWNVGDAITIHKYTTYSSSTTDVTLFTIGTPAPSYNSGTDKTTIYISESPATGTTYKAGGKVSNATRNIKFSLNGASTAMGQFNSNRPRVYDGNTSGGNGILSNVALIGFAGIAGGSGVNASVGFQVLDGVIRNGSQFNTSSASKGYIFSGLMFSCYNSNGVFYYGRGFNISADIYACAQPTSNSVFVSPKNFTISGDLYANVTAINEGVDCTITGNVYGNSTAQTGGTNTFKDCALWHNTTAINGPKGNRLINCKIGYKPDNTSAANTNDFGQGGGANLVAYIYGGKYADPPTMNGGGTRGSIGHTFYYNFQDFNGAAGEHRTYMDYMTLWRKTDVVRTGGASDSIKAEPFTAEASIYNAPKILEWTENDVPALAQTRSVFIRGYGWSAFPANTELYFEAEYISDGTTYTHTWVKSTAVLSDNTTWVEFPVTFTPAIQGAVRYRVYLKKYQASSGIYIDNKLY